MTGEISKARFERLKLRLAHAEREYEYAKGDYDDAQREFHSVITIVEDCPTCSGTGEVIDEQATNDYAHNPDQTKRYKKCLRCEGKGYLPEGEKNDKANSV